MIDRLEGRLAGDAPPPHGGVPPAVAVPLVPNAGGDEVAVPAPFPPPVEPIPIPLGLDDGAPLGPTAEEEAAFLAESVGRGVPSVAPAAPVDVPEPAENRSLPALEELVQRLTPEVRETLEELFRARFIAVRRVPKKAIK